MYLYSTEREKLFTDDGQRLFLAIRDTVNRHLRSAGAVRMSEAIAGNSGDSWTMLACVDRLVELKEILEITTGDVPGQYRVFVESYEKQGGRP